MNLSFDASLMEPEYLNDLARRLNNLNKCGADIRHTIRAEAVIALRNAALAQQAQPTGEGRSLPSAPLGNLCATCRKPMPCWDHPAQQAQPEPTDFTFEDGKSDEAFYRRAKVDAFLNEPTVDNCATKYGAAVVAWNDGYFAARNYRDSQ